MSTPPWPPGTGCPATRRWLRAILDRAGWRWSTAGSPSPRRASTCCWWTRRGRRAGGAVWPTRSTCSPAAGARSAGGSSGDGRVARPGRAPAAALAARLAALPDTGDREALDRMARQAPRMTGSGSAEPTWRSARPLRRGRRVAQEMRGPPARRPGRLAARLKWALDAGPPRRGVSAASRLPASRCPAEVAAVIARLAALRGDAARRSARPWIAGSTLEPGAAGLGSPGRTGGARRCARPRGRLPPPQGRDRSRHRQIPHADGPVDGRRPPAARPSWRGPPRRSAAGSRPAAGGRFGRASTPTTAKPARRSTAWHAPSAGRRRPDPRRLADCPLTS